MILKYYSRLFIDKNSMISSKNTLIETRRRSVNTKKKIDKKFIYWCTSRYEINNLLAKSMHLFKHFVFDVFDLFVIYAHWLIDWFAYLMLNNHRNICFFVIQNDKVFREVRSRFEMLIFLLVWLDNVEWDTNWFV